MSIEYQHHLNNSTNILNQDTFFWEKKAALEGGPGLRAFKVDQGSAGDYTTIYNTYIVQTHTKIQIDRSSKQPH